MTVGEFCVHISCRWEYTLVLILQRVTLQNVAPQNAFDPGTSLMEISRGNGDVQEDFIKTKFQTTHISH